MSDFANILANSEELKDPIFVVGCMRSGTGALARTIGLAESVCYIGETKIIAKYYTRQVSIIWALRRWRAGEALGPVLRSKARKLRDGASGKVLLKRILCNAIRYTQLTGFDTKPSVPLIDRYKTEMTPTDIWLLDQLCNKYDRMRDVDRVLRVLFKDIQLVSKRTRILEKTPMHALYVPTIMRLFPGAQVVHIRRDGREVAASYMLNYGEPKLNKRVARYICGVHRYTEAMDRQLRSSNTPRYYSLQYEDFVTSPASSIKKAFDFLNLSLSDSVLKSLRDIQKGPSNWKHLPPKTKLYVEQMLASQEDGFRDI